MKNRVALLAASLLLATLPTFAQRPDERRPNEQRGEEKHEHQPNAPRANQGRIPQPPQRREGRAAPEPERKDGGRVNSLPHVNNDHWYGHDKPTDKRYHVDRPFEHGRFERFGASYRYRVERFDRDRHTSGSPAAFPSRLPRGTGRSPRTGAGTAPTTILWSTKTPIMTAGICSTTSTPARTST